MPRLHGSTNCYGRVLAGTEQLVEQADAAAAKAAGSLSLARAQRLQQEAILASLDATERELAAQMAGLPSEAQAGRRQSRLHADHGAA